MSCTWGLSLKGLGCKEGRSLVWVGGFESLRGR